jgi:hypothetical protein
MPPGTRSTLAAETVLSQINRDKCASTRIIGVAVEGSWCGYANAMGLVYHETGAPEGRQINTMNDLRYALKKLSLSERLAALYFLTGYTRDVLYSQVLWGASHQDAVEDYLMNQLNARFATSRQDMRAGHKTCVGQLYGQIYNQRKQKLYRATLPCNVALAVGDGDPKHVNWKRPKEIYFVQTTNTTMEGGTKVISQKASTIYTNSKITLSANRVFYSVTPTGGYTSCANVYKLENRCRVGAIRVSTRTVDEKQDRTLSKYGEGRHYYKQDRFAT